jgi:hypothetical protein
VIGRSSLPVTFGSAGLVALALVGAGCGGDSRGSHVGQRGTPTTQSGPSSAESGGSSNAAGSTEPQPALAFASCMRSHGVASYPDPTPGNETPSGLPKINLHQLGVGLSQFQAAQTACRHLLRNGGQATQSASRQLANSGLQYARCMRSHGVSNWPDPTPSTPAAVAEGAPVYMFQLAGLQGLDGRSFSPHITSAMKACQHLAGSQVGYSG